MKNVCESRKMISDAEKRTKNVKSNIVVNFILKAFGVAISFIMLPVTFHYLSIVEYGIWATLFSFMNWINIFDGGMSLGLRNKLIEAVTKEDKIMIKTFVSTGLAGLIFLGMLVFFIFYVVIRFVDLNYVFNTYEIDKIVLYDVVLFSFVFFVLNFILSIIDQFYYAKQKVSRIGIIQITQSLILLAIIILLYRYNLKGIYYFVCGFGISMIFSRSIFFIYFLTRNKEFIPEFSYVRISKIKELLFAGVQFFIIQLVGMLLFSSSSIIITRLLGPEYVREYDVLFKIFNLLPMLHSLAMMPLWGAYTDAYIKKDYTWLRKTLLGANYSVLLILIGNIVIINYLELIVRIWIKVDMQFSYSAILYMSLYTLMFSWNNIYSVFLNAVGKLNIQLIGSIIAGALIIPLSFFFVDILKMKIEGIILAITFSLLFNGIATPLQVFYILKKGNK